MAGGGLGGILGIGAVPVFAGGAPGGTPPFLPSGWCRFRCALVAVLGSILPSSSDRPENVLVPRRGSRRDAAVRAVRGPVAAVPAWAPRRQPEAIFSKAGLGRHAAGPQVVLRIRREQLDRHGRRAHGHRRLDQPVRIVWRQAPGPRQIERRAHGRRGLLAMDGLRRGGKLGVAETHGGRRADRVQVRRCPSARPSEPSPERSAGIVRLFVKGAAEKAKEKIKALYGVDISDKGVLQQIVDMTKSGFGGNLDMAIRSPQIRDLIQLYAMTTGQKTTGMPGTVTPLSLVETGGSLFQSPQYNNGTPLPALGWPARDSTRSAAALPSGGGLVIQLDGPATTALLQGQAVQAIADNPRLVQSATMAATKSNANRRELTSLQLSPGTLVT